MHKARTSCSKCERHDDSGMAMAIDGLMLQPAACQTVGREAGRMRNRSHTRRGSTCES